VRHLPFQASGRTPLLARARERRARKKDHQDAKTHPAPCGRRGQGMLTGAVFREAPARHLPFQASGRPTLPSPLVEEGGRGNEGQKARECRKPHHHAGRSGVHRLLLVEQPAGCAGCGLEARAPWQFRQDAAGIDTRCIQIEHKNVSCASPPQQNNAEQSEQSSPF
jgi:hypothetical protein